MEKLTTKQKLIVVRQYLSGLSYDEIVAKSGISKGMVANIVAELKGGGFPEAADLGEQIETLRELSFDLKHSGIAPGQCAVGLAVLNRIKECDLDAADIGRWPFILKAAGNDEEAKEFVKTVYRIQETLKKSGLTLEEADNKLQKLENKAAELEPTLKKIEGCQKEITELTKHRDDLVPIVNNLEQKYALLNPRVKDLEKREGDLSQRIKDEEEKTGKAEATLAALSKEKLELQKTGFSIEALAEFHDRIRMIGTRHHIAVADLKERFLHELERLDEGLGLEALIQSSQTELQKYHQTIASAKKETDGLRATIGTLEQQKAALEAGIKTIKEKVRVEIEKIIPLAAETVNRFAVELQQGNDEALEVVRHLKDQTLEVGKEIGRYEGIVQVNKWLLELLSLAQGEPSLEAHRVRTIMLQVLRGGHSWMKVNHAKIGFGAPTYNTERLIEELEQWKI